MYRRLYFVFVNDKNQVFSYHFLPRFNCNYWNSKYFKISCIIKTLCRSFAHFIFINIIHLLYYKIHINTKHSKNYVLVVGFVKTVEYSLLLVTVSKILTNYRGQCIKVLTSFQIIRYFVFSGHIVFAMHLNIHYEVVSLGVYHLSRLQEAILRLFGSLCWLNN
jgi:hypothetical protein